MKGKGLAITLSAIMIIVCIIFVIIMFASGQKETYYGYMKDDTTAEKIVSEETHKVTKDVKLPSESGFSPKKGDLIHHYLLYLPYLHKFLESEFHHHLHNL